MSIGATGATHDVLVAVEPENVTAGGIGFVVIAALAVGTALLLRSLNKQLKKVDFDEGPDPDAPADGPTPEGQKSGDSDTDAATDRTGEEPVRNGTAGDEPEEGPRSPAP
jgi:hypothetical protein